MRVLVIDDHELVRDSLSGTLESLGCEVASAEDGADGVALFQSFGADVVITDILMPEQEGLVTITELRKMSPDVRIIAMSGGGSMRQDDLLTWARSLGADEVLAKPFTRGQIAAVLEGFREAGA
ncbi:MAG: response regulator [Kiloniellales bacterium]|nr:response regulator [Kiloniellales bacterium]